MVDPDIGLMDKHAGQCGASDTLDQRTNQLASLRLEK